MGRLSLPPQHLDPLSGPSGRPGFHQDFVELERPPQNRVSKVFATFEQAARIGFRLEKSPALATTDPHRPVLARYGVGPKHGNAYSVDGQAQHGALCKKGQNRTRCPSAPPVTTT